MSTTTFTNDLRKSLFAGIPGIGFTALCLAGRAARTWRAHFVSVHGCEDDRTDAAIRTRKSLSAISNYAEFVAVFPDMPSFHKDRFLAEIVRNCEEIRVGDSAPGGR